MNNTLKDMGEKTTLHFFCGKMAAGKSTLAKTLAKQHDAILLDEDVCLSKLFPDEILNIQDYVKYSQRLRAVLAEHVKSLLSHHINVVLDFAANTQNQRKWFRNIYEQAKVAHILHFIDVSDDVCKRQLKQRSKGKPEGAAFTTEREYDAITKYFQAPADTEGFTIKRYERVS